MIQISFNRRVISQQLVFSANYAQDRIVMVARILTCALSRTTRNKIGTAKLAMTETQLDRFQRANPIQIGVADATPFEGDLFTAGHPASFIVETDPVYRTSCGAAYAGDGLELLRILPNNCAEAVITSPPYALEFKKEYGNVRKADYVQWLLPFAQEIKRILKQDGSFILNIGGSYNPGQPTRSLYHFKLLVALCDELGFYLAQECFWFNPAKLPAPAEWVNVQRFRIKDSVEYVWWLSSTPRPHADNSQVLVPYSEDMKRLITKGYKAKTRPSGHNITSKFQKDHGGAIPSNVLIRGNNESNSAYIKACSDLGVKVHPARYPYALPEFYIKLLTRPGGLVIDPFAGSNVTGRAAEDLGRRWLSVDINNNYVRASAVRFGLDPHGL